MPETEFCAATVREPRRPRAETRRRSAARGLGALVVAFALTVAPAPAAFAADDYEVVEIPSPGLVFDWQDNEFAVFDGVLYFPAEDASSGRELWSYDGAVFTRISDIAPGSASSYPSFLTVFDGALHFAAYSPTDGTQLWSWDGASLVQETNINPGVGASVGHLEVFGTSLVFRADNGVDGRELWSFSGGVATQLADLNAAPGAGSNPRLLTTVGSNLYFEADDGTNDGQLWAWNGTSATMLTSVHGTQPLQADFLVEYQSKLFFVAHDGSDFQLWESDGTVAGTIVAPGFSGSSMPSRLYVHDSVLYLAASVGGEYELWSWDGATVTRETMDDSHPESELLAFDGRLFFAVNGSAGLELHGWIPGSTTTTLIADLSDPGDSYPDFFTEYDGDVYFIASTTDEIEERSLFRLSAVSDGPGLASTGAEPLLPLLAAIALVTAGLATVRRRRA